MIKFKILGQPESRTSRDIIFIRGRGVTMKTPAKVKVWQESIRLQSIRHKPPELLVGPLKVRLTFYLKRPKTVTRELPYRKPDVDNLCKNTSDSLQDIFFKNDSQIVDLHAKKFYDKIGEPRVEVEIEEL